MAIDISGFVTPEQTFGGLYKAADTLERRRYRQDQLDLQREGKRNAAGGFLSNYLDKKDYFTGTPHDPEIVKRMDELLAQGYDLASKGVDTPSLMMALSPGVSKLNEYYTKAKLISQQKKETIEHLKNIPGIDIDKFSNEFDNTAFYDTDPTTGQKKVKDLSLIDPNEMYGDKVLRERDVFNNKGIDDFVAKSGKETRLQDVSVYDRNRAMRRTKAEMTMPSYMISDVDERGAHTGFVPEYEIATDENQPILHTFKGDDKTSEVEAPVRMVTKEVFKALPDNAKAYILQETRKYSKENDVPISSPQSEMFARALAYDELKQSGKNYSTMKEVSVQKAAPIRIYTGSGGKDKGELSINNVYEPLKAIIEDANKNGKPFVYPGDLNSEQGAVITSELTKTGNKDLTTNDYVIRLDSNKDIQVIYTKEYLDANKNVKNPVITTISKRKIDLANQTGVKTKDEVNRKYNNQKTSKFPLPSGKPKTVSQGGHTYTWNESTGNYE